jgi:molybdopterin molybdotransferase
MIDFSHALDIVFKHLPDLQTQACNLENASSFYLAEDIRSPLDLPPFDNSAMDGYAVRSEDTKKATPHHAVELTLIGRIQAGDQFPGSVASGAATGIATGAPLPDGADAVIPVEFTAKKTDHTVLIFRPVRKSENVRFAGEEVKQSEIILRKHDHINAARFALLASIGFTRINVYRKPRVGFLATGNELVPYTETPGKSQIRNSNTLMIRHLTESEGCQFSDYGIARDEIESVCESIAKAIEKEDILITSAGVSVGEFDLVATALESLGLKKHFWKVAIKPGKPILFGTIGKTLYFGLPGNPGSGAAMFMQFISPVLRSISGDVNPFKAITKAIAADDFKSSSGRVHFARGKAYYEGSWYVSSTGKQGSHLLSSFAEANCFVIVPPDQDIKIGDPVFIQYFNGPCVDLSNFRQAIAELMK